MANSTGKIIGLILLIALIMLIGVRVSPIMLVAPFRAVTNLFHQVRSVGLGWGWGSDRFGFPFLITSTVTGVGSTVFADIFLGSFFCFLVSRCR